MRIDEVVPSLVGLEVVKYKNLRDIWLPWNDGMAFFGVNGAGKTNLLECLAILLGSAETVALSGPRLGVPKPGALAVLARMGIPGLPWAPDVVLPWADRPHEPDPNATMPAMSRAITDAAWWQMLGATRGADFVGGVAAAALPRPVAEYLGRLSRQAAIRYSLTHMDFQGTVEDHDGPVVSRKFARTLMATDLPEDVTAWAEKLPDLFAPLRSYLSSPHRHPGPWIPVLELPATAEPPATLQWLPRARTAEEVNSDLRRAFAAASEPARELAEVLGDLPLARPPQERDWHWWLHEFGADRGAEELELTLPQVSITAAGADDADFELSLEIEGSVLELAHTGDSKVLEYFSSGERRWVDEALATVARELTRFGYRAALHAGQFHELDEDAVVEAVMTVEQTADQTVLEGDFWTGKTFDLLLQALEPQLIAAERAFADEPDSPLIRALQTDLYPGLSLLQRPLVVRVFDEPEAHLHPSAQRRTARAIDRLRLRGENVVIASHSPHFLDLPTWSLVHVRLDAGTTQVEVLPDEVASPRAGLARELGVNRGDLLAGINAVLIVEGEQDRQVLQRIFGTQLRAARISVVRMFGTANLLATAELDFLDRYLDVPIVVLLDYTRVDRIVSGRPQTEEEKKLVQLRRGLGGENKQRYKFVGLDRPDIICYLSETAIRDLYPSFVGWTHVLRKFSSRKSRPSFKPWLKEQFGVDLSTTDRIETVLRIMEVDGNLPVGELTVKVKEILSGATYEADDDQTRTT